MTGILQLICSDHSESFQNSLPGCIYNNVKEFDRMNFNTKINTLILHVIKHTFNCHSKSWKIVSSQRSLNLWKISSECNPKLHHKMVEFTWLASENSLIINYTNVY